MTDPVQTKRQIEATLAAAGIRPLKRFGQNFLIDGNLMRRLVEAAEIGADDLVLEAGPGTGGLTDLLVRRAARVVAVEIDRGLCAILRDRFAGEERFTLIEGDVLARKGLLNAALAAAITSYTGSGSIVLAANLPYQAATPLVMNLLVGFPGVRRLVFTVQAEVGARIAAQPGTRDYGPLSIVSQLLGRVQPVARIPPPAFWPPPSVHSVMLRIDRVASPPCGVEQAGGFSAFVRAVFDHRRKTLRAALGFVVNAEGLARAQAAVDTSRRPEELSIAEWPVLYRAVRGESQAPC